jgi:hypothetical protein
MLRTTGLANGNTRISNPHAQLLPGVLDTKKEFEDCGCLDLPKREDLQDTEKVDSAVKPIQ